VLGVYFGLEILKDKGEDVQGATALLCCRRSTWLATLLLLHWAWRIVNVYNLWPLL
jgi:hypothetical protein